MSNSALSLERITGVSPERRALWGYSDFFTGLSPLQPGRKRRDGESSLYFPADCKCGRIMILWLWTQRVKAVTALDIAEQIDRKYAKDLERINMCKIMEDVRNEGIKETASRMLKDGKYPVEEVARLSRLSLDEVRKLRDSRMA